MGLENPAELSGMILKAAKAERKRLEQQKIQQNKQPEFSPGSIERLNYLTGLWQQGLITDEEFEKERKHFDNH
jgi:hypothetical protein